MGVPRSSLETDVTADEEEAAAGGAETEGQSYYGRSRARL